MDFPPAAPPPAVTALTREEKIFTMVGALLGLLLAALDQTIVATAGPAIQRSLAIQPSLYVWITTSYLVASTVLVPIYGKLSDLFGRRRILVTGILIFLGGSLLCGIAGSTFQLILFRAVQGAGSAALFTSAFAVVADIFPPAERGKYQGIFGAAFGLSSVVGPLAGGFITDHFGWHWVFFINLPIGLIALGFIFSKMPPLRPRSDARKPKIDVAGALALAVGLVPLLLALSLGKNSVGPGETGFLWGSWQVLALFGLAVVGLSGFIALERRASDPILDLSLFRNRTFAVGNAAAFISGASFLGAIVFLPLFMVNVVGLSATNSGLTITPLTFGIVAGNIASGQLVSRLGRYKVPILGSQVLLMIGFAVMGFTLTPDSTQAGVTVKMILIGLGLGPSIPLFTLAIQNAVTPQRIGVATSAATFFRQMGSTIGVAILGTVFAGSLGSGIRHGIEQATADVPPAMRSQWMPGSSGPGGGGGEGSAATGSFNVQSIRSQLKQRFAEQRDLVTRAIRDEDPAAIQALSNDPRVAEPLRKAIAPGGVRTQVRQGFETRSAALENELKAGHFEALATLAAVPGLPEPVKASLSELAQHPPSEPEAKAQATEQVLAALQSARAGAEQQAVNGALDGAIQGLDAAEQRAGATVDKIGAALKVAFTDAISGIYRIALGIALLAFLVTLLLPELPLRRGERPAAVE